MSPTIFRPGTAEVKSRFTRSGTGLALDGGDRAPGPRLAGDQAQLAHHLADQPGAGLDAPAGQLRRQPPVAVGAVGVLEGLPDQQPEFLASPRGRALRP